MIHFEVGGRDLAQLMSFYGALFGRQLQHWQLGRPRRTVQRRPGVKV